MIDKPKDNDNRDAETQDVSTSLGQRKSPKLLWGFVTEGRQKGLEPSTLGTTNRCSNQLSYTYHFKPP